MQLFEFRITKKTNIEAFYAFMRNEYPDIIGRKRFCCYLKENTTKLRTDCSNYGVYLKPIPTFVETTFTENELDALQELADAATEWGYKEEPIFSKIKSRSPIYFPFEMECLHYLVEWVADHCGGGEDTIGAIMYTGAFHKLKFTGHPKQKPGVNYDDAGVVKLAKKIDSHENYDLREND